jgi:hypothetical protein
VDRKVQQAWLDKEVVRLSLHHKLADKSLPVRAALL